MKEKRLVLAVTNQAPLDKIQEILDHHPLAIKSINKFTKRTPLHWACQYDTAIEVLRVLVEQHPEAVARADNQGMTPLHVACCKAQTTAVETIDCLLKACPKAAKCTNQEMETPLHNACLHKAALAVLQVLIQACPEAVLWKTRSGQTPLDLALDTSRDVDFLDPAERPVIRKVLETTQEQQLQVKEEREKQHLEAKQAELERQRRQADAAVALEQELLQQHQLKIKLHAQRKDQEARTAEIISKKREAERQKEELRRQLRAEMERQAAVVVAAAAAAAAAATVDKKKEEESEEEDSSKEQVNSQEQDDGEKDHGIAEEAKEEAFEGGDDDDEKENSPKVDDDEVERGQEENEKTSKDMKKTYAIDFGVDDLVASWDENASSESGEEEGEEERIGDSPSPKTTQEPRSTQSSPTTRLTAAEPRQQPEDPAQQTPPGLATTSEPNMEPGSITISPNAAEAVLAGIWGVPLLQETYELLDRQPIHHLELERELVERSRLEEVDTFFQQLLSKPTPSNPHTASVPVESIVIGQISSDGSKMAVRPPPGYEKAGDEEDDENETLGMLQEQILQHRNELDLLWKRRSDVSNGQSDESTSTLSPTMLQDVPLFMDKNLEPEGMVVPRPSSGDALPGLLLALPEHQQLIHKQQSVWRRMGMTNMACQTPLHLACARENPCTSTIRALIDAFPVSVKTQNGLGQTPLHLACSSTTANVEVIRLLLDACSDSAHMADREGNTPLHVACASGCPFDVIQLLLETFAERNDADGVHH